MRIIFRCDPALADHLPRPIAARGASRLAEGDARERAFGHSWPGDPHGEAMPAIHRRHGHGVSGALAMRCRRGRRDVLLGLAHPGTRNAGTSACASQLSCSGAVCRRSFREDGTGGMKFNSFWTIELEDGWSLFATHPINRDDLPFRLDHGSGRFGSLSRWRHQFSRDLDGRPIFPASCRRARRSRNVFRFPASRRGFRSKRSMPSIGRPIPRR